MLNLLKYNSTSFCGVDVWGDLRGGENNLTKFIY